MATVECPIEDCGYEGTVSGVEAHISGLTRDGHEGRSGGEFRDRMIEDVERDLSEEPEPESAAAAVIASTLALAVIVVVLS